MSKAFLRDITGSYAVTQHRVSEHDILSAADEIINKRFRRGRCLQNPDAAKALFKRKLGTAENEKFVALLLDTRHRVIKYLELFNGTIDGTSVHPREVVKAALKYNAAALLVSHCHPSGVAQPSTADKTLTRRLQEALALVDVRLLDHVVVAGTATVSLAELGLL